MTLKGKFTITDMNDAIDFAFNVQDWGEMEEGVSLQKLRALFILSQKEGWLTEEQIKEVNQLTGELFLNRNIDLRSNRKEN